MIATSAEFRAAVANREPQIALLIFDDCIFSNSDIRVDKGIEFHDYFNTQKDLSVGQALSNEISFTLYNDDRLLNNYAFGEFKATIGVRTQTANYTQKGNVVVQVGGVEWVGSSTSPYLKRGGSAVSSQPAFAVTGIGVMDSSVYVFGSSGQYSVYNTSGGRISRTLNAFMQQKGAKWRAGYYLNTTANTLTVFKSGRAELYEFAPLGVFKAERPDAPDKIELDFTCYDRMQRFEEDYTNKPPKVQFPLSLRSIYESICNQADVPHDSNFPGLDIVLYERPKEFDSTLTLRQVLMWIAEAAGRNAKFDRNGTLKMVWIQNTGKTYNENNYSRFDPYWYQTPAVTKVLTRTTDTGYEGVNGSGETGYLVQDNPFLKMYREVVASQEEGPWTEGFDWMDNDIDIFDNEWQWDLDRIRREFASLFEEEESGNTPTEG